MHCTFRVHESLWIHQQYGHRGIHNLVYMCLFTQVIYKSLANLAMFMWVKGWETSTRWPEQKTLSRNLSISLDDITKSVLIQLCSNTFLLVTIKDLNWPGLPSNAEPGLPTYTTILPLLSSIYPLLLQDLSLYWLYVSYTHSHPRPMDDLRVGDMHAEAYTWGKSQAILRNR